MPNLSAWMASKRCSRVNKKSENGFKELMKTHTHAHTHTRAHTHTHTHIHTHTHTEYRI